MISYLSIAKFCIPIIPIALLTGVGLSEVTKAPTPRGMVLEKLEFRDGMFTQKHIITGTSAIRGAWSASIYRGDDLLCNGGGHGVYQGVEVSFSPDVWTGDQCPILQDGDIAKAVWEYKGSHGEVISILGELVIGG